VQIRVSTPQRSRVESVVLMRRTATTHLVDSDQRAVKLRVVNKRSGYVDVVIPNSHAVVPGGPYLLFINVRDSDGTLVPSLGAPVSVPAPATVCEG
jgi:hypothetical protein